MFKIKEGLKLFNNQTTVRYPTGTYGSFEIDGGAKNSYEGFSIGGRAVFMHDNGTAMGLYNDVNNQWALLSYFGGDTRLYHAGNEKISTKSDGVQVQGLLKFNSGATTTSQSYGIEWTGFDKEGTTDYSDSAYIKHLTNTAGLSGSVLEISSMNDANDGINLKVNSSTAGARVNGNPIFHDGYHPNADKWTTARRHTVTLTGDVTGSAYQDVDGTGNKTWTISTVVGNNSHTHDTIDVQDVRNTTPLPSGLASKQVQSFFNNQTIPSGLSSWYSTLTVKGWDGTYAAWELAGNATSSAQDGLFFRYGSTNWSSWQRVFTDSYHPNADKWTTARTNTVTLTGDATGSGSATVDGSGNWTVTVNTVVADNSHSHSYLPLSGGTLTGSLTMSGGNPVNLQDSNHYLKKIGTGYSGVTIDGPQLQGHQGGELTTNYGGNSWAMRWNISGDTVTRNIAYANASARAPIFYDLDDTSYYVNPNGISRIHTLQVDKGTSSSRDKIRLWNDSTYTIGMQSGVTYGPLNDWAMTFQFNHESDRGFWWGSSSHSTAQGAMALSTYGHLYVGNRVDAPIFYDSNNTAYYVDAASTSVLNALTVNTINGYSTGDLQRIVRKTNGTAGAGWMTVADCTSARHHGEIYVTDGESSDHSFIRIDWMRSYADSNFTVLNVGGHSNRITAVRVLRDGDITYGRKVLQVYVTASSNYYVRILTAGDTPNYGTPNAVTPVIQNGISGYSQQGSTVDNLEKASLGTDQGIRVGGEIRTPTMWVNHSTGNYNGYNENIRLFPAGNNVSVIAFGATGDSGEPWQSILGYSDRLETRYRGTWEQRQYSGYVEARGSSRAPIFYDSNDTAWYTNPASTSRMRNIDVCSITNTSYYYDAAIEVREYNMAGAQADTWANAPRVAFHWGGRVASSIALSSNGWINIMNNPGTGFESLRCGNFYATGNVTAYYSDERLKTKVGVIENALDKVLSIDTFKYINNNIAKENGFTDEETQVGVSAQSVEKVLPEVVKHAPFDMLSVDGENTSKSGEWYKTVQYDRLVPLLIEAIKEQQTQIEDLSSQLKSLKENNNGN